MDVDSSVQRRSGAGVPVSAHGLAGLVLGHELGRMMRGFGRRFGVRVMLFPRGGRVSIVRLSVPAGLRGRGRARRVLSEICAWADSHGYVLAIGPTGQWGAEVGRLVGFYASLGFTENVDITDVYRTADQMVRLPVEQEVRIMDDFCRKSVPLLTQPGDEEHDTDADAKLDSGQD